MARETANKIRYISFFWLFLSSFFLYAQEKVPQKKQKEKIKIIHSDELKKLEEFPDEIFMTGHVKLEHNGVIIEADTITLNQVNNVAEAISNVTIFNPKYTLTSNEAMYDGNTMEASAQGNVVLRDSEQTLYTDKLIYDRKTNKAYYNEGGTIVSKESTINSKIGIYDVNKKLNTFEGDVNINNKDYYITSKELKHHSDSEMIEFFDDTYIQSKKNRTQFIKTNRGTYYLNTKEAFLEDNSSVHSDGKSITAKKLYYNQITEYGKGEGNVLIDDPKEKRFIKGDYGEAFKSMDSAYVTGNALAVRAFTKDSLYLHADTLMAVKKDSSSFIKAYYNARFFKSNVQGKADSIGFSEDKGTVSLYRDPIMWSDLKQITGDTIRLYINLKYEQLDSVQVRNNSFAISKRDSITAEQFNQVKSKNMSGVFVKEQLDWVQATGNAQSLTYLEDDNSKNKVPELVGIARSDCGIIQAKFIEGQLNLIACKIDQKSKMYPPHLFPKEMYFLPKFLWREKERFKRWQDILVESTYTPFSSQKEEQKAEKKTTELEKVK